MSHPLTLVRPGAQPADGAADETAQPASDRELLARIRARDETALEELIGRKTGPLLQHAARYLGDREEARDVVQVSFLKMWDRADHYDPRWSPNTWIYRIVTNLAIDTLRARGTRERHLEAVRTEKERVGSPGRPGGAKLIDREVREIFLELAEELSEKQRAVFLLREVEDFNGPEVARMLSLKESTVRNHLFNARRTLRVALADRYPEYARLARRTPPVVAERGDP